MSVASISLGWRKIKADLRGELTETSIIGSFFSVAAAVLVVFLVYSQISDYRTIKSDSNVVLDHYTNAAGSAQSNSEDTMQINFNFSFPHLSCEYASVDATNFMGTHDAGLAARVSKIHLDKSGRQLGPHKERRQMKHDEQNSSSSEGDENKSLLLTTASFEKARLDHEIMVVNFFTPWCHWCQRLEPVWEKSNAEFVKNHAGDKRLVLAKVDCTADNSDELCTKNRIDAFPTIMVFRRDDLKDVHHERYHGDRTVEAITTWADVLMKQLKREIPKSRVVDGNKDGEKESHNGVGCMIAGMLHVQRAPGGIVIQAQSDGHEFNWATMDVSHTVNHLSFGPFLSETAWAVMPPDIAQAVGSLDDKSFTSERHIPTTHEHLVKIVKNVVELPSSWRIAPVHAHGYVVHSNNVQRYAEVPTVRINYDILPIIVHVKTSFTSTYHFVTQLCAIVGGVFTVAGMVAASVETGLASMKQKETLGKLG